MKKLTTEKARAQRDAARTKYAEAVTAYRAAFVDLHSLDILLRGKGDHAPGFGTIPDIVVFRHAVANPNENGSLQTDVAQVIENTEIEG